MPISREVFQIGISDDQEIAGEDFADLPEDTAVPAELSAEVDQKAEGAIKDDGEVIQSQGGAEGRLEENLREGRGEISPNLPTAEPTSAGKQDEFGAAYPQKETRRSVATGRDVPQFKPHSRQREREEINWDEARAQTEVYERRARAQKEAATEHLGRIHDIVELMIEMSEAHSNAGERKLQSLESKVAELETRYAVNRSSP